MHILRFLKSPPRGYMLPLHHVAREAAAEQRQVAWIGQHLTWRMVVETFGAALKEARKYMGWNQRSLATALRMSDKTIGSLESGGSPDLPAAQDVLDFMLSDFNLTVHSSHAPSSTCVAYVRMSWASPFFVPRCLMRECP